ERPRDRVDGEVTAGQVVLDRAAERREVDGSPLRERDAPAAVGHRERERRAAGGVRVTARSVLRLAACDVKVDDLATEQLVAHGAADDPGVLAGQQPDGGLKHRRHAWLPG